jgi:glycosyltransferase involved in cell wall biosynthesis
VITGTEFTAQLIEKFYGVESSRICISPFPVPSSKDVKSNSKSDKVFLYPAQFWPHKNHLNLIQGFAKALNASGEKLKLILPGSDNGMLEKCKNEVARLGVIDFVFFPGFVSDEELRKYFQECRNIIYPSLFGPDNLPPLEGLSACCNVYVAEIPGAREVYGENVKYFDPLSSDSISEVFLEASNHSDEFLDVSHKRSSMLVTPSYSVGQVFRSIKLLEPYIRTWKPNN